MKLSQENDKTKLLGLLTNVKMTKENLQVANDYFDFEKERLGMLLKKIIVQEFTHEDAGMQALRDYFHHVFQKKKMEVMERMVLFLIEAGGSSAFSLMLNRYECFQIEPENSNDIIESIYSIMKANYGLEDAQARFIVMMTQSMVDQQRSFDRIKLAQPYKDRTEVLYKAMDFCTSKYDNTKMILSAIILSCTSAAHGATLTEKIKGLFTGSQTDSRSTKTAEYLRNAVAKAKPSDMYMIRLIGTCGILAMEHSPLLLADTLFKIKGMEMSVYPDVYELAPRRFINKNEEFLEKQMHLTDPGHIKAYMEFALNHNREDAIRRICVNKTQQYIEVMKQESCGNYSKLLNSLKKYNEPVYQVLGLTDEENQRECVILELLQRVTAYQQEIRDFLNDKMSMEQFLQILPQLNPAMPSYYYYSNMEGTKYFNLYKDTRFLSRYISFYMMIDKLSGSVLKDFGYDHEYKDPVLTSDVSRLVSLLKQEGVPMELRFKGYQKWQDGYYSDMKKESLERALVEVMLQNQEMDYDDYIKYCKKGPVIARTCYLKFLDHDYQKNEKYLLEMAQDTSKQVIELLTEILISHKDLFNDVVPLLESKKMKEREVAVAVLESWGPELAKDALTKALEKEKSEKLRIRIQMLLNINPSENIQYTLETVLERLLKGNKKKKVQEFIDAIPVHLHDTSGNEISSDYVQALLIAYADMGNPGISADADSLAASINPEELSMFAMEVFSKWVEDKAQVKKKWVLFFASIHGQEPMVDALYSWIKKWPEESRGAIACEAVRALSLSRSPRALVIVDGIARKFKFRQVKEAANQALLFAATQLSITKEELSDRIVPTLGFDAQGKQIFDYGKRSFTVYLSAKQQLEVYDEANKQLKSLPAPGKNDEAEKAEQENKRFKELKKQIKTVVSNQKLRLEYALLAERIWTGENFKKLFVENPIMHSFAIGLIWGIYDNKSLKMTFRYMEDGSFTNLEDDEIEIQNTDQIQLIHPIDLKQEEINQWKEQLSDYEIEQPITQLDLPVYRPKAEDQNLKKLDWFEDKPINGYSLLSGLLKYGWYKGSVEDGGCYYSFYREDITKLETIPDGTMTTTGHAVELHFSGVGVGCEDEEVTVGDVYFYQPGTVNHGTYGDHTAEKMALSLAEVSPRYFSEVVRQLSELNYIAE